MSSHQRIFATLSQPLEPLPTGVAPRLTQLAGIRAVLFDIYGTLLISGSGDIGATAGAARAESLGSACETLGFPLDAEQSAIAARLLRETITEHHQSAHRIGILQPEVDIIEVWRGVLEKLRMTDGLAEPPVDVDLASLAVEYEARVNPAWPMPGMEACLGELRARGKLLGLISNAQFFTLELFPALVGKSLDELGFDPSLRYYSYERRHAKPSTEMFVAAREALASRGVQPTEVVYVGNDMRNDIGPAHAIGYRTVLFAGDARSLRMRVEDAAVANLEPDAVVTNLAQLSDMIST